MYYGRPQPPPVPPPPPQSYGLYTNHAPQYFGVGHAAYPSPPNMMGPVTHNGATAGSPAQNVPLVSEHWQQQLLKAEISRSSRSPHHRARASAMATRSTVKSAVPITNPNPKPLAPESVPNGEPNGISSTEAAASENHPSSTAAPTVVAPRPTEPKKTPESNWSVLDMGGISLKNIPASSGLFTFIHLTVLYLNHNALASVPAQISSLRNLTLLDLSGNDLVSIPGALGMITSLKELYLFDNHLTSLPGELGSLHELELLGVEGNPLENQLKNLIQKEGTQALIRYLRDSCPVPTPPPERVWRTLQSDAERKAQDSDPQPESFSVLCYNILCERYATSTLYGYTPSWALDWNYRKELILTEIMNYDADFLCLQEVDLEQYENYFLKNLSENSDYAGVYHSKSRVRNYDKDADKRRVDGCAMFYKNSKYALIEERVVDFAAIALNGSYVSRTTAIFDRVAARDDIGVITLFENRETGSRVIVANVHIYWNPVYSDVKLIQTYILMSEIQMVADRFAKLPPRPGADPPPPFYKDGTRIPTIVAGDFNSVPDSGVCEFISTGALSADHPDFLSHTYGLGKEGMKHNLTLRNSYAGVNLSLTNCTPGFNGVLDYIWYSASTLSVTSALGEISRDYLNHVVGFPNAHFPSDHVCIVADFRVKPQKEPGSAANGR